MREKSMNTLGEEMPEEKTGVRGAATKASEYADSASTSLGRSIESAAGAISGRAGAATDSLAKAGRYLQEADPKRMGRDLTHFVKDHPTVSLAAGFGLGLLIGRVLSR